MVTGNVSTVLFNDISSALLAFYTYLIWATDFKDEPPSGKLKKYFNPIKKLFDHLLERKQH